MKNVVIYTQSLCGFCSRAKRLLDSKGVDYTEIDVTFDPETRGMMRVRASGKNTVPQIFIGDAHVGGCDDLFALEQRGELDAMLAG